MARLSFAFAALTLATAAAAEPQAARIQIKGDVSKPGAFSVAELEALGPIKASWMEHQTAHEVYGVPLDQLLAQVGFSPGPMGKDVPKREKRAGWRKVLRASAPDGFQAIFSCAELWDGMGPTRALLVWQMDGKPLSAETGPFRIVVLTDKEPSRSIYQVATLEVIDLRS